MPFAADKAAAVFVDAVVIIALFTLLSMPFIDAVVDDDDGEDELGGGGGGAITADADVTTCEIADCVDTGAVISAFMVNLLTRFGSSLRFTDKRFDSNVFISLESVG